MEKIGSTIIYADRNEREAIFSSEMYLLSDVLNAHYWYNMISPEEGSLYKVLNDFILRCHQYGFIKHIESNNYPAPIIQPKDPNVVLTLYILSAGFYLWLISIVVACFVFVGEHVVRYFSRTRHLSKRNMDELFYVKLYD